MTKEEAFLKLKEAGKSVSFSEGMIIFTHKNDIPIEQFRKESAMAIKEIGYKASWGITYSKLNAADIPEESPMIADNSLADKTEPTTEPKEERLSRKNDYISEETGQLSFFDICN